MGRRCNKPWASYRNREGKDVDKTFPTYTKLRAAMKSMLVDSIDGVVRVTRTRRGEWGQWAEQWEIDESNNKLKITKQTWL